MKISVSEFFDILDVDQENVGEITLTKTMLDKCIIDANVSVVKFAAVNGIEYTSMDNGHRVMIEGKHLITTSEDICETVTVQSKKWIEDNCRIVFYKTARGDRRISISGIKKYAAVGDKVALTFGSNGCLIINISRAFGEELSCT